MEASSIVEAVNDLWIDAKGIGDYPRVLECTANFHGLNPVLLDRKFRETHGRPEAVLPLKRAGQLRELGFRRKAKQRLRYHLSKGHRMDERLLHRVGQRIVRNNMTLYFVGLWWDQYGGYLFVQESDPRTLTISFKEGADLGDVLRFETPNP
ncbi:hypothetical protein [Brevundimonas sp. TWP3-1-2b1]|uniref:hypothetical protein n=1 Tax=Brevundimonas sp. TWP3-1-2b1 TaxID=2804650 RepID=UPI003CE7A478